MDTSGASSISVTVISGEDLRLGGHHIKSAFAVLYCAGEKQASTKVDADGGSYPSWNEKFRLTLLQSARFISVEVHCKTVTGTKMIGTAHVPVSDFRGGAVPAGYLHFLSYRLRDVHGRPNGIINLSIRIDVPLEGCSKANVERAAIQQTYFSGGGKHEGSIAIGVPVGVGCKI